MIQIPKAIVICSIHDEENDPDCDGDYCDYELYFDGKLVKNFGDEYHNDASSQCSAFIEGIEYAMDVKLPEPTMEQKTRKF